MLVRLLQHNHNRIHFKILQHCKKDYNILQNDKLQSFLWCGDEGLSFLVTFLAGGLATYGSAGGA
jgi:hypothetical protein